MNNKKSNPVLPIQKLSIVEHPENNTADLFIYSKIGYDWYVWDDAEQNTASNVATKIHELGKKYDTINIRINSVGGDFFEGNAIITAIKSYPDQIHTWNDGLCASMAADIWLAAKHRHKASNALTMIHPAACYIAGNAKELRAQADILDTVTATTLQSLADATGKTKEECNTIFYENYTDNWYTYDDLLKIGVAMHPDSYQSSEKILSKASTMSYKQLVSEISKEAKQSQAVPEQRQKNLLMSLFEKMLNITDDISNNSPAQVLPNFLGDKTISDNNMTDERLEALLKESAKAAVAEYVASQKPLEETPIVAEKTISETDHQAALAAVNTENATLQAHILELEKQGAGPTEVVLPATPPSNPVIADKVMEKPDFGA